MSEFIDHCGGSVAAVLSMQRLGGPIKQLGLRRDHKRDIRSILIQLNERRGA